MKLNEETVNRHYLYKGKIVNLRCDDALLPDGRACKREVIEHSGGASVLSVLNGNVVLVRQFRYAYGEELLEIPAGKLNAGEDPLEAAKRELEEETGLHAQTFTLLFTLYPTPGYTNEKIYIYEATDFSEGSSHLDDGEFLNVEYYPVEEALKMIENGTIKDAKTIVALLRYARDHKIS